MNEKHLSFGMPTLIELPNIDANVRLCKDLGLSFIELNMDLPMCQPNTLPAEKLAEYSQHGIHFTIHLPEKLDLATFQEDIRTGHIACLIRTIEWARRAGIDKLTMHIGPGVYFTLPQGKMWLYEKHRKSFLANLQASIDKVLSCAARADVTLLIENTGSFRRGFVQEAIEMLLARHPGNLGLTWDVGHDAESGYADSPFFRRQLDRVAHMHLHDFDGRSAHQALFAGSVDIPAVIDLARLRQATVVIETKTVSSLRASIEALRFRGLM